MLKDTSKRGSVGELTITQAMLARSLPPAELVGGDPHNIVVCSNLPAVGLHPTGQPYLTDKSEREFARLYGVAKGMIAVPKSAKPDESSYAGDVYMAAGCLVFTDRRVVGAFIAGDILSIRLSHGSRDQTVMMISLDYARLRALALMRKNKTFGGIKNTGICIYLGDIPIQLEIGGETTLDRQARKIPDLEARFRSLVQVVADFHLGRTSDPSLTAHLRSVKGGALVPDEDGWQEAVFIPDEDEKPPAPPPVAGGTTKAAPAPAPEPPPPVPAVAKKAPYPNQPTNPPSTPSPPPPSPRSQQLGERLDELQVHFAASGFEMTVVSRTPKTAEVEVKQAKSAVTRRYRLSQRAGGTVAVKLVSTAGEPEAPSEPSGEAAGVLSQHLVELDGHFRSVGSEMEIVEQSDSEALIDVRQKFLGARSRRYRLFLTGDNTILSEEVGAPPAAGPAAVPAVAKPSPKPLPVITDDDPIGSRLAFLAAHYRQAGSQMTVVEHSDTAAEIEVTQKFIGSRRRRYRLALQDDGGVEVAEVGTKASTPDAEKPGPVAIDPADFVGDPIGLRLAQLQRHYAGLGATMVVGERSATAATVEVSRRFLPTSRHWYALTLDGEGGVVVAPSSPTPKESETRRKVSASGRGKPAPVESPTGADPVVAVASGQAPTPMSTVAPIPAGPLPVMGLGATQTPAPVPPPPPAPTPARSPRGQGDRATLITRVGLVASSLAAVVMVTLVVIAAWPDASPATTVASAAGPTVPVPTTEASAIAETTTSLAAIVPSTLPRPPTFHPLGSEATSAMAWGAWLAPGAECPAPGEFSTDDRFHLGMDLLAEFGTPVHAVTAGEVVRVSISGWGPRNHALVVLHTDPDRGTFTAVYGNLRASWGRSPVVGDVVERGQQIGVVGRPGGEPEPFLHLGIHPGDSEIQRGDGRGLGQMLCSLWVDGDFDGRPDDTNGFVDPLAFLGLPSG